MKLLPRLKKTITLFCLLLCTGLMTSGASADIQQIGENQYVVGVPTEEFVYFAAPESTGRQQASNWCWAACIQMVLNYHGVYSRQEDIVRRVFGDLVDQPANGDMIVQALSGWSQDLQGTPVKIQADAYNISPVSVIQDLQYRWPLIVGLNGNVTGATGHAYVLTGAYFYVDQYNNPQIYRLILRDPWPENPSRLEMTVEEFTNRMIFATRVQVVRQY